MRVRICGLRFRDQGLGLRAQGCRLWPRTCATAVGNGVTQERGEASAVASAGASAGSCGMLVHFPSAPSKLHP